MAGYILSYWSKIKIFSAKMKYSGTGYLPCRDRKTG